MLGVHSPVVGYVGPIVAVPDAEAERGVVDPRLLGAGDAAVAAERDPIDVVVVVRSHFVPLVMARGVWCPPPLQVAARIGMAGV